MKIPLPARFYVKSIWNISEFQDLFDNILKSQSYYSEIVNISCDYLFQNRLLWLKALCMILINKKILTIMIFVYKCLSIQFLRLTCFV